MEKAIKKALSLRKNIESVTEWIALGKIDKSDGKNVSNIVVHSSSFAILRGYLEY